MHAAIQFTQEHPSTTNLWYTTSNYLVSLAVADETELKHLIHRARDMGLELSVFQEPDIGNQITAICLQPSPLTQRLVKRIPLLLNKKQHDNV